MSSSSTVFTKTLEDGSVYHGQMNSEGLFHGKGKLRFSTGELYVGEFKNGMMHGYGNKTYNSGIKYQGEWKLNKKSG